MHNATRRSALLVGAAVLIVSGCANVIIAPYRTDQGIYTVDGSSLLRARPAGLRKAERTCKDQQGMLHILSESGQDGGKRYQALFRCNKFYGAPQWED